MRISNGNSHTSLVNRYSSHAGSALRWPAMPHNPTKCRVTMTSSNPKKLINPVKASKSHQELHRELLQNHRRGVENKSELQRVLEQRKRDQMIKQRKMEDEARRKVSPLEQELLKRQQKLYELEREQERQEETSCNAPEFIKVKENLRRTSFTSAEEKQV